MVNVYEGECFNSAIAKHTKAEIHRNRNFELSDRLIQYRKRSLRTLKKARNNKSLCLFLGAGVSLSAGLPGWKNLVEELADKALYYDLKDTGGQKVLATSPFLTVTLPILARVVKEVLPSDLFIERLHGLLYNAKKSKESPLIKSIYKLVGTDEKIYIKYIITYNYDDLIEKALSKSSIHYTQMTREDKENSNTSVQISHVHGLLPEKYNDVSASEIILSEEDYNHIANNPTHWINKIQENLLTNSCCLFIGLSLHDTNLRRLLDKTKTVKSCHNRYVIFTEKDLFREQLQTSLAWRGTPNQQVLERARNSLLPAYRNALISRITESLGVTCIWLDSHEAIPKFLDSITEFDDDNKESLPDLSNKISSRT